MADTPGKAILIVLDGVGIGALPDASDYGDEGSDTLGHIAQAVPGMQLPNLRRLGLGNIAGVSGIQPVPKPSAAFGRMAEASAGKDSTTGHWEIAGLVNHIAFPTYPNGFPAELMEEFVAATGCGGVLGNKAVSGTAIIDALGAKHIEIAYPIVYTSADSVFQVAAHEETVPLKRLYEICAIARNKVCVGKHEVSRVIARPFIGTPGNFTRTANRRDFSVQPRGPTLLDILAQAGIPTRTIGKVDELFAKRGVSAGFHTRGNAEGIREIIRTASSPGHELVFANLVDFDTLYGHRNDPVGFARALEEFDAALPEILGAIRNGDLLIITADHGNDPVTPSTDHSREYVPLLCLVKGKTTGTNLGTRKTFADAGKTIAEYFGAANALAGSSFSVHLRD